jgi:A/G-specific adenine glycosylase
MEFAAKMLPDDGTVARSYNLALVDFGALVCEKRQPQCEICFAADYCDYYETEVS